MNALEFHMTSLWFGIRDLLSSPKSILRDDILARVASGGLFGLSSKGKKTYSFSKTV